MKHYRVQIDPHRCTLCGRVIRWALRDCVFCNAGLATAATERGNRIYWRRYYAEEIAQKNHKAKRAPTLH